MISQNVRDHLSLGFTGWLGRLPLRFREDLRKSYLVRLARWHLVFRRQRSPWSVSIETAGACNRKCSYCPVSANERTGEMPRALFSKIVDDLAAAGFNRTLSFHFYNEPLLDARLPELVALARLRLPHCTFDVFTNGDFLTAEWIRSLFESGIDVIRVSLHSPNSEKRVRRVLESVGESDRRRVAFDSFFDREDAGGFLYNRLEMAGADGTRASTVSGSGCSLVNSLAINYEGSSALCCNDFFATNGHGSLRDMTVEELWRQSRKVRQQIYLGRFEKPICQICNVGGSRFPVAIQG